MSHYRRRKAARFRDMSSDDRDSPQQLDSDTRYGRGVKVSAGVSAKASHGIAVNNVSLNLLAGINERSIQCL